MEKYFSAAAEARPCKSNQANKIMKIFFNLRTIIPAAANAPAMPLMKL